MKDDAIFYIFGGLNKAIRYSGVAFRWLMAAVISSKRVPAQYSGDDYRRQHPPLYR